ncbi:hypothetical protein B0H10DRAFT_2160422 [Mycena sp. CBHHK59/15]|nr:hypothetical protein B0H10DRAFT_2160422 [Mycena sp. CBHHK59/15]
MSRALGAAFLNHQVEQLEKSAASVNWRSRTPQASTKRTSQTNNTIATTIKPAPRKKNAGVLIIPQNTPPATGVRRSLDDEKDADVVVVDASVLVHALHQVKKWCRDGRAEVVIVPLEALNTLDLLKKGTSSLAQRARAASRILEAQVGTNPRIRVQQDDAFIPWDAISLTAPASDDALPVAPDAAPEWVRRTVCCARWELDQSNPTPAPDAAERTVRLAVLAPAAPTPATPVATEASVISKHEPRAAGTLVAHWAALAGVAALPVAPSAPSASTATSATASSPISIPSNANTNASNTGSMGRVRAGSRARGGSGGGSKGNGTVSGYGGGHSSSLVERPPAALAMMDAAPGRVIKVLARGERLDAGA